MKIFRRFTFHTIVLNGIVVYLLAVVFSVMLAHIALIIHPDSALAARLIAPVRGGLDFLDDHWKGALLIVAPFLVPAAERLTRRIRKFTIGDTKIELEDAGIHEKPQSSSAEDSR